MGNIEYWILGQVVLEGVLLAGVVFFLLKFRKMHQLNSDPREIQTILQETHLLKDELLDTLQARKAIISNLIKQLDQKVTEAQHILKTLEKCSGLGAPASSDSEFYRLEESGQALRERVEMLSEQGLSLDQIAANLRISRGEVMLILDLMRAESR